ncbi:hypothetical protein [Naumannella halotolerans]|uniref:Replication restart DNA helicase PriA n=1 Tax=Naumannella halotolerans TaxID=993414 RepID=A0A4R7IWX4_9ACTN|nr:hypothetical protein [Naumannella halotolerans]TDT29104.1 hypothetical protein CLV29_3202 [Naumannella halotolerans]
MPSPEPMPSPPAMADPAALHATEDTRTYPCRSCGGMLVWEPRRAGLQCSSCGLPADLGEVESTDVTKHPLQSAMAALLRPDGQAALDKEVTCQACGGTTAFTGSLSATRCPYCATPIQRDDLQQAPTRLPIDGVLPFALDERHARDAIEQWIASRRFAPKEFKQYRTLGAFSSVYLSYFDYDADAGADYRGQRGEDYQVTVKDGDRERQETHTRWYPVHGQVRVEFRDLDALANTGLDDRKIDALAPWPREKITRYAPHYVAGHLSRTYDLDAQQVFDAQIRTKIDNGVDQRIRSDIGGDRQRIDSKQQRIDRLLFAQLLLPVWLLTVTYGGQPFQVYMNGVTGKVVGERPWSKIKIVLLVLGILAAVALVILGLRLFGG